MYNGSQQSTRLVLCDAGIDDALALIFLGEMTSGGADYIVCNGGNVNAELVANNCAFLKDTYGWESQLFLGSNSPYQSECDASYVHGPCGLGERHPPAVKLPPLSELRSAMTDENGLIDVLVLGPSTDVPELFSWPGVMDRINSLTVMGAAFEADGNVTPYAEFNVYMDPGAAEGVMKSDCASLWVPLDVTREHLYRRSEVLPDGELDQRGKLIGELYDFCAATHRELDVGDGVYMHDVLAAAVWLDLVDTTTRQMAVEAVVQDGEQRGRIVFDAKANGTVSYVTELDHEGFLKRWTDVCCSFKYGREERSGGSL